MRFELDHLFVCTAPGAPEAEELVRFGLLEGPPNQHLGQGTANRRFSFRNAMLELLWVSNPEEAQSEPARRTLLWERWSGRQAAASPFGICLRPAESQGRELPFPAWEYRPPYLPDPLCMYIGEGGAEEPMWVYLDFMRRAQREKYFLGHPCGVREVTGVALTSPVPLRSAASKAVLDAGVLRLYPGTEPLLELEFDGGRRGETADFRPHLPLVFKL